MTRRVLFLLLVAILPVSAETFYLGTYTKPEASHGIYVGTLDENTGALGPLKLAAEAKDPGFLVLSPDHRFIYAAQADSVGAYAIQPDGMLKKIREQPSGGSGTCHVGLDGKGKTLLAANYNSGNIVSFPIAADGSLGAIVSNIPFTGSGPDPVRQKKPYAHSVYVNPENKFVYSCDLGTDNVWIFTLNADSSLTPADPPSAKVPPGGGPRHLAFGPGGKFVYVVNEMGASVTVFARNAETGGLNAVETVSNLTPDVPRKGITAAEIFVHPSGKWLYVSTRGCELLSVFTIADDGKIKLDQTAPSLVQMPRNFGLDPTGRWLISAGQKDGKLAVLAIDPKTGKLSATEQTASVGMPVCVLFVP